MKGLEGRPLVGVRMANIPPAKIPISTLKSRFTFGLRPPLLKKVPHTKQVLGIFRICSTNRRLALVSGLGQPRRHRRRSGGALGNHYGDGNRRYDDDDDYRDRRYYRRAGYRDGYYRHDNGHHYGQYKKWKRHKHHRRYYDD